MLLIAFLPLVIFLTIFNNFMQLLFNSPYSSFILTAYLSFFTSCSVSLTNFFTLQCNSVSCSGGDLLVKYLSTAATAAFQGGLNPISQRAASHYCPLLPIDSQVLKVKADLLQKSTPASLLHLPNETCGHRLITPNCPFPFTCLTQITLGKQLFFSLFPHPHEGHLLKHAREKQQ